MKFLVDAHLPRKLAIQLKDMGYDTRHTLGLPLGNRTTDQFINELSIAEQRIVITKDSDFVDSFWLQDQPWKLLLVSTGNIRNDELKALFHNNMERIQTGFAEFRFIELTHDRLIFHV
jgi:predicted nuclease of predicted toxin-antitoxin system